ncbi:MAG: hypothetical protein GX272_08685 [Epulopiscium sp.]|nr:hypothetical protein [Candidatus Epulonipiscium sp.]
MDQQPYELPDGWEWKSLKDICDFENGDRGKNYPSRDAFVEKGIPVINAGNLNGWTVDSAGLNYINEERYNLIGGGKIKRGDILYCLRGSLGKCGIVDSIDRGVIASSLVIVRPSNEIIKELLLYYFNSSLSSHFVTHYNNGAAQPNLSAKSLSLFKIPLPPLSEQKRIVEKLDALISRIDQAVNHLQESLGLAEALFASSLDGAFNPLGSRKNLEGIYELPDGWEWKKLGEVIDFKNGYAFKSKVFSDQGIPVLRISNIQNGSISDKNLTYYPENEVDDKISQFFVEPGEIVIAMSGATTGKVAINDSKKRLLQNQRVGRLCIQNSTTRDYVYWYLSIKVEENLNKSLGAAQPNLSTSQINNIDIPFPNLALQSKIVIKINTWFLKNKDLKKNLQSQIDDLIALKVSLLDSAFRGEL